MATERSRVLMDRVTARRRATVEEILDHAEAILGERGAGAVTVSEIARRMGMKAPSVYKYFSSLNDIYDALFARGQARLAQHLDEAIQGHEPGLQRLLEGNRAFLRWATRELGLASLLFWRPVPGFEPSSESMVAAGAIWQRAREEVRTAVARGELAEEADSDEAMRLLTIAVAGVFSQQASNQPGVAFEEGAFTSLTNEVLQMYVDHYQPRKVDR